MQDLLAIHAKYLYPVNSSPITEGGIVIHQDKIIAVDYWEKIKHSYCFSQILDLPNTMVLPAAINTHTHLELTDLTTAIPEDTSFVDWILALIKARNALSEEELQAASIHGIQMMQEAATAAVGEIATLAVGVDDLVGSALHGIIYYELLGLEPKRAGEILAQAQHKLRAWQQRYHDQAIRFGLSLHAPYTVSPQLLQLTAAWCKEYDVPLTIHIAESAAERELLMQGRGAILEKLYTKYNLGPEPFPIPGCMPVTYLDQLGILAAKPLLVHSIEVTAEEICLLQQKNIPVVHCPRSNMRLLNRRFPLAAFLDAGVLVTMGTDSMASCSSLSIWDEIRAAWWLHQQAGEVIAPHTYLTCATLNGAKALQVADCYGSIAEGKKALLAMVNMEDFNLAQQENANAALYAFITGQGTVTAWQPSPYNANSC